MLFVTFLLSGIILFLLIYAYSLVQIKKQDDEFSFDSEVSESGEKLSLFEKFKRKKKTKKEPEVSENSSVSIGGVTAKVSSSIKQVVAPIAEKVPSRKDRKAPQLVADLSIFDKTKQVVKSEGKVKPDLSESLIVEGKAEPSQPLVNAVVDGNKSHSVNNQGSAIKDSVNIEVDNNVQESMTEGATLERLAEEYAAQHSNDERISPDSIEQVYDNQSVGMTKGSLEEVEEVKKSIHEPNAEIAVDLQQNSVENAEIESAAIITEGHIAEKSTDGIVEDVSTQVVYDQEEQTSLEEQATDQNTNSSYGSTKEFRAEANAVEIVAKMSKGESMGRDDALVIFRKYDYLFTRHIGIFGKNSLTEVWENIEQSGQEQKFSDIALSLQLADKTGAMTRKESNTFSTLAIEMSDQADKKLEFSMDIDESVEKGRMLDELARKYDAMVVCNIIPKRRKGFRSTDIKSCTKDLEMMPSKNGVFGRFAKVENTSSLRYSLALANNDGEYIPVSTRDPFQVDEIVVFMNVPLVVNPSEAFVTMINDARKLGAWMDGKIVDKNARNMTTRTLDKIAEQISLIENEMGQDGLIPGSEICKKLF